TPRAAGCHCRWRVPASLRLASVLSLAVAKRPCRDAANAKRKPGRARPWPRCLLATTTNDVRQVPAARRRGTKGKTVQIRCGAAAVIGQVPNSPATVKVEKTSEVEDFRSYSNPMGRPFGNRHEP